LDPDKFRLGHTKACLKSKTNIGFFVCEISWFMPFCFSLCAKLLQLFAESFRCIQYWAQGLFNVKLAVNKKVVYLLQ